MKRICITSGNLEGIGSEVILKSLYNLRNRVKNSQIVVIGSSLQFSYVEKEILKSNLSVFSKTYYSAHEIPEREGIYLYDPSPVGKIVPLGRFLKSYAKYPLLYLNEAISFVTKHGWGGVVTAPIDKKIFPANGLDFRGHTEFFASKVKSKVFLMTFVNSITVVGVVTTHVSLFKLKNFLTKEKIVEKFKLLSLFLKKYRKVDNPCIAVCCINPHCGDDGSFGIEDRLIVEKACLELKQHGFCVKGPFPADALFSPFNITKFHGILAMYHDQATIPVKLLDFSRTVNVTLGLPFVRTSPDHGTAYDIAEQGKANSMSMESAILLCLKLVSDESA